MPNIDKTIYFLNREQEERHTQELAKKNNLPYINLSNYPLTTEVLNIVPQDLAISYQAIPYLKVGRSVKIGVVNPNNSALKVFLDKTAKEQNLDFILVVISRSSLIYGLFNYQKALLKNQKKEQLAEDKEALFQKNINSLDEVANQIKTTPEAKLLDLLIYSGIKLFASDIHLEPGEKNFSVRFRLDGVLKDVASLPMNQYKMILSKVKYLAKMRMDKYNEPQDGRFSFRGSGNEVDIRVSVLPSSYGESLVLRILNKDRLSLNIESLGFRPDILNLIKRSIARPNGIVLTSGPTGSGKTTTMYAILMELKRPEVKIITLEDPIEYRIEGLEQSQINKEINYGFSQGLRAILRQDPDIVMVGEVRDKETAEIAVQAAMTGHLILSTIHANSAPAVYVRLLEIGVKPFLLAGSVNLVMAQRLVRKVCDNCMEQYSPKAEIWQEIKDQLMPVSGQLPINIREMLKAKDIQLVRGAGCSKCNNSGYENRQVIAEALLPSEEIESLISKKGTISEFERCAKKQGMITMEQDGLIRVLQGTTTVEEVWRVTKT